MEKAANISKVAEHYTTDMINRSQLGAPSLITSLVEAMPLPGIGVRGPSKVGLPKAALVINLFGANFPFL